MVRHTPIRLLGLFLFGVILFVGRVAAQPPPTPHNLPQPRLLTVTPNGGKAGTTVEVTFTGTDIEDAEDLLFSTPTLKAEPIETPQPTPDPKKPDEKPAKKPNGMRAQKIVASKFKVVIPADAPVGIHDVRLSNKWGLSNPRAFVVGDLLEVAEKEPNNDVDQAQRVPLNCTVSGTIAAPTDVDYYVFPGDKGQRVIVSCLASSIDSRLFPALECYDARGQQLASNVRYRGTDALLDVVLPTTGEYLVRVFEFSHIAGSAEHQYRLSFGTGPWIDAVYPPVIEMGKTAEVTIYGRNLPGGKLDPAAVVDGSVLEKLTVNVSAPADPRAARRLVFNGPVPPAQARLDGFEYRLRAPAGSSNGVLLGLTRSPVVFDNGQNQTPRTAQLVPIPCEIAGRVERLQDHDWYSFQAKKGESVSIELLSDRIGAPTDMSFMLFTLPPVDSKADPKAAPVAPTALTEEFDDEVETLAPFKFVTRSSDPARYKFTAPADGTFLVKVVSKFADLESGVGPQHQYRLRISPEQPDFRLVLMPAANDRPDSAVLLQGGQREFDVFVWRIDGFAGPVTISAEGLPAGVSCPPQVVGTGLKHGSLVLNAAADAPAFAGPVTIIGTATINGQPAVREARAASILWPIQPGQNIPTISRLDRALVLSVRDKAPYSLTPTLDKPTVQHGDKATLTLKLSRLWPDFKQAVNVTAVAADLPPNLKINNGQPVTIAENKTDATTPIEVPANVPPGIYAIFLQSTAQVPFNKDPKATQKPATPVAFPATPLTLTILPKQVANLSTAIAQGTAKPGGTVEVIVKVARQFDYAGEFKVSLQLPTNMKGVSADEIVIPAGKDEAKLLVKIAPDAVPGNRADLVVRAVALLNGNAPATHETKITLNIVK